METTIVCWGNIGKMEKQMETTLVYWGNEAGKGSVIFLSRLKLILLGGAKACAQSSNLHESIRRLDASEWLPCWEQPFLKWDRHQFYRFTVLILADQSQLNFTQA